MATSFCCPTGNIGSISSVIDLARTCFSDTQMAYHGNPSGLILYNEINISIASGNENPAFDSNWGGLRYNLHTGIQTSGTYTTVSGIIYYQKPNQNLKKFFDDDTAGLRFKTSAPRIFFKSPTKSDLQEIEKAKGILYRDTEWEVDSQIRDIYFFGKPYMYEIELIQVADGSSFVPPRN